MKYIYILLIICAIIFLLTLFSIICIVSWNLIKYYMTKQDIKNYNDEEINTNATIM